jgi:hypothetical protein
LTTQQGLVDCYQLEGPYNVVFKVEPPLSGRIQVNSAVLPTYPFQGIYYGAINTELQALSESGWSFDHWEAMHHTFAPSMTDSVVNFMFTITDTIIAHFTPPIQYEVVLMPDPPNKATITFDGIAYNSFPVSVPVAGGIPLPLLVAPNMFYDFKYWEVKHNLPNTNDSTRRDIQVTFYESDTIIAHLEEQDYAYWAPNAFSPGNVIDPETFELEIYDRWGRVIYTSDDPHMAWDGGTTPLGVYAFRVELREGITHEEHKQMGYVTVIR